MCREGHIVLDEASDIPGCVCARKPRCKMEHDIGTGGLETGNEIAVGTARWMDGRAFAQSRDARLIARWSHNRGDGDACVCQPPGEVRPQEPGCAGDQRRSKLRSRPCVG